MLIDINYQWRMKNTQEKDVFDAHYQGEIASGLTVLLGGSGEGKSTLLHLLGGFLQGQGSIQFLDKELIHLPPDQRPMTTLFQNDNLFPQLTVWQNVAIGLANNLRLNTEQLEAVEWALARTQIDSHKDKRPSELSGGQAQRVAIARAIARAVVTNVAQKKSILLLDEPFSALDPSLRLSMLSLVQELTEQLHLTTLLVSHLPEEVKQIEGILILIEKGRIALQDNINVLNQAKIPDALKRYLQ